MATTVARLQAILSANTRDFDRAMTSSQTKMQRVGAAGRVLGGVLAGAVVVGLIKSAKEAMQAEQAQTRLETAFKAVNVPIEKHSKAIEEASKAAINLGFDDEALIGSLGSLIVATGNFEKAQGAANVAMDLARFKGVELEAATKMLTMAMGGSQRAVKQLGISVVPVTTEFDRLKEKFGEHLTEGEKVQLKQAKINDRMATAEKVIETVRQKVRGQADAYRNTAQGEMEVFRAKVEELEEKLGKVLLPAITRIVSILSTTIDKLEKVNEWMSTIGANQSLPDILKDIKRHLENLVSFIDEKVKAALNKLKNGFQEVANVVQKVVDGIKWLIDKIPDIPKLPDITPGFDFGDPRDSTFMGGTGPGSVSPALYDELSAARNMGLILTSGYRPGARTKHGTPSDHGVFPSKAIDVSGTSANMARFFRWLIGQTDVKQAFYDPLGSIFGGVLSSYREGGHSDHVHVATYDRGGWLQPGLTLAANNTGRPEYVGAPMGDINLYVDGKKLFSWFRDAEQRFQRRNG